MIGRLIALLGFSLIGAGIIALALNLGRIATAESNTSDGADPQVQAVKKVHDKFYSALNAMFEGDPKPFEDVWWHTDDIVYMGADGAYNVGWEQTYANWKKQAALKIGGKAEPSAVRLIVGKEIATANQYVTGINYFNGEPREIKLRATSVFRQKDGVWKMICHHVDVIPPLGNTLKDGK